MNLFNLSTGLLILGFAILAFSVLIGAVRLWKSNQPGERLTAAAMVVAGLVIVVGIVGTAPTLLAQFGAPVDVAAQGPLATAPATETKVPDTSTPTSTLTPTVVPTHLPTLTPAPSATDIVLVTPLVYTHADTAATTECSVLANTMLNLRGDPSVKRQAIGRVFAGSRLPVTGRSADNQWWRVTNNDGKMAVEGWVSVQYVTADKACDASKVPVIDPTPTPTRAS